MSAGTLAPAPPDGRGAVGGRTLARPRFLGMAGTLVLVAFLAGGIWSFAALKINVATMVDSAGNAVDFVGRMLPLDFSDPGELLSLCWQTLAIVACATLLSLVLSLPVALLAARNTTPFTGSRLLARTVIVLARAIPDVVFAIVAFRVFGLGGMTGVIAMGLHSIGMVGKLTADAIEQIDEGPVRAIRATGASRLQEIAGGVLPQVLPSFVATALHRFDINLRSSVVLGFVGVNGLGYALSTAIGRLDYQRAVALAIVLLLLCFAVELVSGAIRRSLLRDTARPARKMFGGLPGFSGRQQREVVVAPQVSDRPRVSPRWSPPRVRRTAWFVLVGIFVIASVPGAQISAGQFARGLGDLLPALGDFFPLSTGGIFGELLADLWTTVQISLAGTLIGVVLALPLGALAARNVAPSYPVARIFRTIVLVIRGIPELVLAIIFVVITGLGPVAGALALGIGSIGLLGKLVADSLEELDPGPGDAVLATGASRWQMVFSAIVPRAWPTLIAHIFYQVDVNIRAATLLGIVGAGGIGFRLLEAERILQFGTVATVIVMMLAVVLAVEGVALWLRHVFT
jgi:phosphonate transport system permease protein